MTRPAAAGSVICRSDGLTHLFPPLLPKDALRAPVLAVAAHPDDEVIGCGGMLAWHRECGHAVTVVHATDGGGGDPQARFADIAAVRRREAEHALAALGVDDLRRLGLPDGGLPEHRRDLVGHLRAAFAELAPHTLYSFFFAEAHRDHRALASAVADCAPELPADCRVLLFGVNHMVAGGTMFDVTAQAAAKARALAAFHSQLAYNDFAAKVLQRDHAATVNIEDPRVQRVEVFADLRPAQLAAVRDRAEELYRLLLRPGGGA